MPASRSWRNASTQPSPFLLTLLVFVSLSAAGVWAWMSALSAFRDYNTSTGQQTAALSSQAATSHAVLPYTEPYRSALVARTTPAALYLYASPTTQRYLLSLGLRQSDMLKPWQDHLTLRGYAFTETTSLSEVRQAVSSVLIIPGAIALAADERMQIKRLHDAGVSILVTWATGVRDGGGDWVGYDYLDELLGIRVHGHVARDSDAQFLNLRGETPLTIGYPAGRRIWLGNTTGALLKVSGGQPAATMTDWRRSGGNEQHNAAVLFDVRGSDHHAARWAYFSFPETAWASQHETIAGLLDNTLHWLGQGIAASVATWPLPYQAAYMLEMDTEEGFETAYAFGQMMDQAGIPATFYILTSEGLRYPRLVRHLAKRHEIAYHGDDHSSFLGMTEQRQRARFQTMQNQMKTILNDTTRIGGFRAPYEQFDSVTQQLLQEYQFNHHAGRPGSTDAMLPYFQRTDGQFGKRPVVLPRTQYDDLNLEAGDTRAGSDTRMLREMLADFETVVQLGGMGLLSIHSQYFQDGGSLQAAMRSFLAKVAGQRKRVWFANGSDIAHWWHERDRISLRSHGTEEGGVQLRIEIGGHGLLRRGAIIVTNFAPDSPPVVTSTSAGPATPEIIALDRYRSAIVLNGYPPGSYAITLAMETETASTARRQ